MKVVEDKATIMENLKMKMNKCIRMIERFMEATASDKAGEIILLYALVVVLIQLIRIVL